MFDYSINKIKNMTPKKDLYLRLIRCNECNLPLDEIRCQGIVDGFIIENFVYYECPKCGEEYSGYEYRVDEKGDIIYFKLNKED